MPTTQTDANNPGSPVTIENNPPQTLEKQPFTHDSGVTTRQDAGGGSSTSQAISNLLLPA
ncbi:MAG: hypothetical protein KGS09_21090 [Nitrospirae bacterium]|nr:hypothetical protein [Nitrospirota bacterium]